MGKLNRVALAAVCLLSGEISIGSELDSAVDNAFADAEVANGLQELGDFFESNESKSSSAPLDESSGADLAQLIDSASSKEGEKTVCDHHASVSSRSARESALALTDKTASRPPAAEHGQ